jgi:hypothetical protein
MWLELWQLYFLSARKYCATHSLRRCSSGSNNFSSRFSERKGMVCQKQTPFSRGSCFTYGLLCNACAPPLCRSANRFSNCHFFASSFNDAKRPNAVIINLDIFLRRLPSTLGFQPRSTNTNRIRALIFKLTKPRRLKYKQF